jgi:hypothetical protein
LKTTRLPEPKRIQSVVEWQFPRAHRYWDDCGKLIAAIEKEFPRLKCEGLRDDGFHFSGLSKGITGALFFWDKAFVVQAGQGDAGLAEASGQFWPLIETGLSVAAINRLGHRTFLLYEASPRDALAWLENFRFVTLDRSDAERTALGVPDAPGTVLRTKLEPGGRRLRLELNTGTTRVERGDLHGVIVDIDIAVNTLDPPESVHDFIDSNIRFIRQRVEPLFRRK